MKNNQSMHAAMQRFIALVLALCLLPALPISAQAAEAHPGMITIKSGQSVGDGSYINYEHAGYPFKMTFELDENTMPLQSCRLGINSWDCDEDNTGSTHEWDQVYVNNTCVGLLTGSNQLWKTSYFDVPLKALKKGTNTITIYVGHMDNTTGATVRDTGIWLLKVSQAVLQFDGGKDENAPDSFKLQLTSAAETATGITCTATAQIQSKKTHSYVIEYSLVDLSINQIVADDEANVSGTDITSRGHFYLPADAPRGNYRIEATLRDDVTHQVYATASYNFNLEKVLDSNCKHVGIGNREYVTTDYYKLKKDDADYASVHKRVDTYSKRCRLCNATFYEYETASEAHTLPICVCGFVEEGFNPIYSAILTPVEYSVAGGEFKLEIVTHDVVTRVTATNDTGVSLNESKWVVTDNADGTRTFSRVYKADLAAENRVWTVKAYNANGRYLSTLDTNGLTIYETLAEAMEEQVVEIHTDYEAGKVIGICGHANSNIISMSFVREGMKLYQNEQKQCKDCGVIFTVNNIVDSKVSNYLIWSFNHFEPKEPIIISDKDTATEELIINGNLEVNEYSIQAPYTVLEVKGALNISGPSVLANYVDAEKIIMKGGSLTSPSMICDSLSIKNVEGDAKNRINIDVLRVKENATIEDAMLVSDVNTKYYFGGDLSIGGDVKANDDQFNGTIVLTGKNPKVDIKAKIQIEKLILTDTAPYWFSFGKPVFWEKENNVNAKEIIFGKEPSDEDKDKLRKLIEKTESDIEKTNEKREEKKNKVEEAAQNYNAAVTELSDYLITDEVKNIKQKQDPFKDFAIGGYFNPVTQRGTEEEDEYKVQATMLFAQAMTAEFFSEDTIKIPETGKAVVNIIAGKGSYEFGEWILDFTHVGAGGETKSGQTIIATCYKKNDDIENIMTKRYVLVASSTNQAVGEVLAELTQGALEEIVQQLVTLTKELFIATDGLDAVEELIAGIILGNEMDNEIKTLEECKTELISRFEKKVFSEVRGVIGSKIEKIQGAYETIKNICEECIEMEKELETYKGFLDLYNSYLK